MFEIFRGGEEFVGHNSLSSADLFLESNAGSFLRIIIAVAFEDLMKAEFI